MRLARALELGLRWTGALRRAEELNATPPTLASARRPPVDRRGDTRGTKVGRSRAGTRGTRDSPISRLDALFADPSLLRRARRRARAQSGHAERVASTASWSPTGPAGPTPNANSPSATAAATNRHVDAGLDRALADLDPPRGISQLTASSAAAFVPDSAGVTLTKVTDPQTCCLTHLAVEPYDWHDLAGGGRRPRAARTVG